MNINDDLIQLINLNNDFISSFNFICSNKNNYNVCKTQLENLIKIKKKYLISIFPDIIFELMNGISKLVFSSILKYKIHFGGDYIDRIQPDDMSSPLMIGIDLWRRPFIAMRIHIHNKTNVVTIFQRYTDNTLIWTHGCSYDSIIFSDYDIPRIIKRDGFTCKISIDDDPYIKINIHHLINNDGYVLKKHKKKIVKVPAILI